MVNLAGVNRTWRYGAWVCACVAVVAVCGGCEKPADQSALRAHRHVLVTNILLRVHWSSLETNEQFKPVVEALVRDIDNYDYEWKAIRPAVNIRQGPEGKTFEPSNAFERDLLKRFSSGPPTLKADKKQTPPSAERIGNDGVYHYYEPIYLTSNRCVLCHRQMNENENLSEGDLQAIVHVWIPADFAP